MPVVFVLLMLLSGALVSLQGPLNARLARTTGPLEAALVSFGVGTLALAVASFLFGSGSPLAATRVPSWQLLGGLLGALFVTGAILAVPRIGVTASIAASLAGQLSAGLVIDRFGWFGVPARPVDLSRAAALALLLGAVWLLAPKR